MGGMTRFENRDRKYIMSMYHCDYCNQIFNKRPSHANRTKHNFCSQLCTHNYRSIKSTVLCKHCNSDFTILPHLLKNDRNRFCSQSCAAKYNNTHKTKGTRRSKLELWLESKLTELYPTLLIQFNKKDTIGSELDIYIPSLKLAFELNGIFHYEPIFGADKLQQIQSNDTNKFQKCQELGISLCIIDVSSQKYFKEQTSKKYLDIILTVISQAIQLVSKETT